MKKNNRILIVDDEPEALKGYEQFLIPVKNKNVRKSSRSQATSTPLNATSANEFEILKASTGEEAIAIFKKEKAEGRHIAAGFFDVKLGPGIDGLEVIKQIKEIDSDILCVVVTAYQDRSVEDIDQFFGEDFKDRWDFMTKPFTQGEIAQKARQMIAAWNRKIQLKATQNQLIASERLAGIGQVARGVGHEFGNILQRIMGKADLALMETNLDKMKNHVEVILQASERAGVIVRNLQSFAKTEPHLEAAVIDKPINDALSLINHEFIKASVQLEKKITKTSMIEIDCGALGQVFLNLFINAIHAMPGGGKLTIETKELNQFIEIHVKDTGSGIATDILPHVFEFAYTTKGDHGSGIGLSISKEIIEAHRGTIQVQSREETGTQFIIQLPKA